MLILFETIDVVGPSHPSTSMLPAQWHVFDEMSVSYVYKVVRKFIPCFRYNFKSDPRAVGAVVILSANESSYIGR